MSKWTACNVPGVMRRSKAYHAFLLKQAWKQKNILRLRNERLAGAPAPGATGQNPDAIRDASGNTAKLK